MTYDMAPGAPTPSRRPSGDVLLSRAELAAAMHELDSLRAYGTASNADDHLAVLENAADDDVAGLGADGC